MPLNWYVSRVKDHDKITTLLDENSKPVLDKNGEIQWNPVTQVIALASQWIGIARITNSNYEEVYARMLVYDKTFGGTLINDEKNVTLSLQDVMDHIGMYTNGDSFSRTEFWKRIKKRAISRVKDKPNKRHTTN